MAHLCAVALDPASSAGSDADGFRAAIHFQTFGASSVQARPGLGPHLQQWMNLTQCNSV